VENGKDRLSVYSVRNLLLGLSRIDGLRDHAFSFGNALDGPVDIGLGHAV
jgi:hypothetical protein